MASSSAVVISHHFSLLFFFGATHDAVSQEGSQDLPSFYATCRKRRRVSQLPQAGDSNLYFTPEICSSLSPTCLVQCNII